MAENIVVDLGDIRDRVAKVFDLLAVIVSKGERLMSTVQELNDELDVIVQKTVPDYIAGRDAIDADLQAQIAALTSGNATLQAGVDAAFAKAEAEKALLTPPAPTPPATGTPTA